MKSKILAGLAILLIGGLSAARVQAQEAQPQEAPAVQAQEVQPQESPAVQAQAAQPGVARVSLIHGEVSTQRGDAGDWVASVINAPVVAGDRVAAGKHSRAELQLDFANILRLGDSTEVKIADLTRTRDQVQVRSGLINYTVLKGSEADVEIDTPNVAIRPLGEGSYRVLVVSAEETQVIVRKGEAEITTPQGSTQLRPGELITIRGSDNPEYQTASAPSKDAWDDWNKSAIARFRMPPAGGTPIATTPALMISMPMGGGSACPITTRCGCRP